MREGYPSAPKKRHPVERHEPLGAFGQQALFGPIPLGAAATDSTILDP
jgi:hypothetical protein